MSQHTTVRGSARSASIDLLSFVSVTAGSATSLVKSMGNLASELELRSDARLDNVKHDLHRNTETRRMEIDLEAGRRRIAIIDALDADPRLAKLFAEMQKTEA